MIVTLSKEIPTILNCGDETVELRWNNSWKGQPTVFVKASKDVGITGAHLLQKSYFERDKMKEEIERLQEIIRDMHSGNGGWIKTLSNNELEKLISKGDL